MTTKLSPNDRCHCGSGKKYKRCCLDSDRAADAAAMAPPPAAPSPERKVAELADAYRRNDMAALAESLGLVAALFQAGGPLGAVRFAQEKFDAALAGAVASLRNEPEGDAKREKTLKDCVRGACDVREAKELVHRMDAVLKGGGLPTATVGALKFWLATTEAALAKGDDTFLGAPLMLAIAGAQADEHARAEELARAREEIPRLLEGRRGLKVLAFDEHLLLTMELSKLRADHGDGDALHQAIAAHFDHHPIAALVLGRLRQGGGDAKLSSSTRDQLARAERLLGVAPALFLLNAIKLESFEATKAELAFTKKGASNDAAMDALAAHYESLGLPDRAARTRQAAAIARALGK
ncbi:MAG: SEC-C domain-containing protein [Myxococcales bacterium]